MLEVEAHPLLELAVVAARQGVPLGTAESPGWVLELLRADAPSPLALPDDEVRAAVRDLLRFGGYKPTGRGKPASEYLVRAASEGSLRSINIVVDIANAVSLHSGLPLSVVDLGRVREPLRVAVAAPGTSYVFNASGQAIDVGGLLCLHDAEGPIANAVKDSERTKTRADTERTLTIIWGSKALADRVLRARTWLCELLSRAEAIILD
jgi:DNA/RNA-binding domain of Phe-tRNA-synthetase-like protein